LVSKTETSKPGLQKEAEVGAGEIFRQKEKRMSEQSGKKDKGREQIGKRWAIKSPKKKVGKKKSNRGKRPSWGVDVKNHDPKRKRRLNRKGDGVLLETVMTRTARKKKQTCQIGGT